MINIDDLKQTINSLVEEVVEKKNLEASIDVYPDNVSIRISPWKPYDVRCPYGKDGQNV